MVINMIDKTHKFVKSYQDVLDVFGYFPTFHDDKIVKYSIKKNDLFVTIRTVQNGMNSLSKKGYHDVITQFKFMSISNLEYNFNRKERSILGLKFDKSDSNIKIDIDGVYDGATHFEFICESVEVISCKGYTHYRDFKSIKELYDSVKLFLDDKVRLNDNTIEITYHNKFIVKITGLIYFKIVINEVVYSKDIEAQDIWYFIKEMDEDLVYYVQYKSYKHFIFKKKARIDEYLKDKFDVSKFINDDKVVNMFDCKSVIK